MRKLKQQLLIVKQIYIASFVVLLFKIVISDFKKLFFKTFPYILKIRYMSYSIDILYSYNYVILVVYLQ